MGKSTGFIEYKRVVGKYKPVKERIKNFNEFITPPSDNILKKQGARCMDCGIPYCHSLGCPLNNLIPEWNDLVYRGEWKSAFDRLELTNNFPEITGRICPAPCEKSCTLSINDSPVTIHQIERAIADRALTEGWVVPKPPKKVSGKRVAVIGSGPSGLAAAQQLRRAGHDVVVFEKDSKPGGIMRYGIPNFKLDKKILDRRIEQMENEGIEFETDVLIGEDISARYLKKTFDAVLLTVGARKARELIVEGRDLKGVYQALEYLTLSTKYVTKEISKREIISTKGKRVLVIGGGDTGSDCVGTAIRQGAEKVFQYEIMPKPMEWDEPYNPDWPDWPFGILRTSSSHEEGCVRDWSILTKSLTGEKGKLTGADFVRVNWEKKDDRFVMKEIEDSQFHLDIDLILLAMGFVSVEHSAITESFNLEYDNRGNILVNDYATSEDGVFAAGDSTTGASLVVRAIDHGRKAAVAINKYLHNI